MLDRFGKRVLVGWPEHHRLYLEAALTLPRRDRLDAFRDIAEMTGRGLEAVRAKAHQIEGQRLMAAEAAETARRILVASRRGWQPPKVIPSDLRQPTKAQMMGARA